MRQTINLTEAGLDSTVRLAEVKLDGSDTGSECGPEYGPECIKGNVIICPGGAYRWPPLGSATGTLPPGR